MPCIQIKTNVSVSEEAAQAVKSQLGQIITCLPEKTEDWLMITLEDGCRMWFRGEKDKPMAIVEVKVFGDSVDRAASERMTREVCGLFQQQLGVDPRREFLNGQGRSAGNALFVFPYSFRGSQLPTQNPAAPLSGGIFLV